MIQSDYRWEASDRGFQRLHKQNRRPYRRDQKRTGARNPEIRKKTPPAQISQALRHYLLGCRVHSRLNSYKHVHPIGW